MPETSARLDGIDLQGFQLSNGWLRLTNVRQENAPVVVSIDLDPMHAGTRDGPDDTPGSAFSFHIAERYIRGYSLRHKLAVDDFLRALQQPRLLQIVNYATFAPELDIYLDSTVELDPERDRLMDALRAIQDAFPDLTFPMPESLTRAGYRFALDLEEIVTTGEHVTALESARVALLPRAIMHVPDDGIVTDAEFVEEGIFTLWGTRVELGAIRTFLPPVRIVQDVRAIKAYAAGLADDDIVPAAKIWPKAGIGVTAGEDARTRTPSAD